MYVCAINELKLSTGRVAKRGEPLPEVDSWPEAARRANENLGYIKKEGAATLDDRWGPRPAAVGVVIQRSGSNVPNWLALASATRNANAKFEKSVDASAALVVDAAETPPVSVKEADVAPVAPAALAPTSEVKKRGRPRKNREA